MLSEKDYEMAPCLRSGPIADEARELVVAARALGVGRLSSIARALSVPYLFNAMEGVFASGNEPVHALRTKISQLGRFYRTFAADGSSVVAEITAKTNGVAAYSAEELKPETATGEHFGRLFKEHSTDVFWAHPLRQLRRRPSPN
jgi:hypothetical protein